MPNVLAHGTCLPLRITEASLWLDSVLHQHKSGMTTFASTVRVAEQVCATAGLTPADIDVAEVHDFCTGVELIGYECLGLGDRLDGQALVEADVNPIGGALPVNPSAGLKAKGHPPGALGVAQCVEVAHDIGGPTVVSAVTNLEGPGAHGR